MNGYTIRFATPNDLSQIRGWLEREHNDGVHGSFFCNYNMIEAGQEASFLTALVRESDQLPVAFSLGDANIDILAVKADCRRQGLGRYLAQHVIDHARERDIMGMHGECAPPTSKPFWRSLGFRTVAPPYGGGGNGNWIACPLPHENHLQDGPLRTITVALTDGQSQGQPIFQSPAVETHGHYLLARDFVEFMPQTNTRLEVHCDGNAVFSNKNKYVSEIGGERRFPWVRLRRLNAG